MPTSYRDRLLELCKANDSDLVKQWNGFIPNLVTGWTQLSVVVRV